LYGAGTANNYLAGRLAIGTTSTAATLTVFSSIADAPSTTNKGAFQLAFSTSNGLSFGTYSTSPFANYIQSISHAQGSANYYPLSLQPVSGNVLIGSTTDNGYKLQVNGGMSLGHTSGVAISYPAGQALRSTGGIFVDFGTGGTGDLVFRSSASVLNRLTLDNSGNLGLGVTPSAWGGSFKALQVGLGTSLYNNTGYNGTFLGSNFFYNGTNNIYLSSTTATAYGQVNGQHQWFNAPSGTLCNVVSFTQAMTLDASGNLLLGNTTGTSRLDVAKSASDTLSRANSAMAIGDFVFGAGLMLQQRVSAPYGFMVQATNSTAATFYPLLLQPNGGNVVLAGTSDTGEKLQVTGTAKITGATTLGATTISTSSSTALAINSSASACYLGMSDSSGSFTYLGSDNGAMLFQTPASSYSTKMTLDSSGNLGLGVTPSAWAILKGLQVGLTASISGYAATTEGMFLMSNSFYNGGAFVYQVNGFATTYLQQNGEHRFQTAASGTAGNNITFTRPMTLTAAGRLLLGTTVEGTNLLDVVGTARITGDLAVDTNTLFVDATNNRVGVLTTTPSEPLHVAGNMLISGANSFKMRNLAGTDVNVIRAVSGGTSVLSTATLGNNIAIGTQSAHDFLLCSSDTERIRLSSSGWFSHTTATNPSSSVTDSYVQYSADVTAGNAAPHFRTENGAVIKLYQETTAVGNSIISLGGGNSVLDDTTFDGYTLRQIVKALRNQGILA
jgi:hypothetical protein